MARLKHLLHLDARDGRRVATITFPRSWLDGTDWVTAEGVACIDLPCGGRAWLANGLLQDGSLLVGLVYPGGQRVLRALADHGVEEHFSGRLLNGDHDELLVAAWSHAVQSLAGTGLRNVVGVPVHEAT